MAMLVAQHAALMRMLPQHLVQQQLQHELPRMPAAYELQAAPTPAPDTRWPSTVPTTPR